MSFTTEKLLAAQQANVTLAFDIANALMSGTEQLVALNLATARSTLEDSLETTRAVFGAKSPTDLLELPTSLFQPTLEKNLSYWRGVYDIQMQTAEELASLFEAQRSAMNKEIVAAIDSVAKHAPAGTEIAFSTVKSAIAAANSAYDNLTKAARQVTDLAEANVEEVTRSAKTARPASSAKARKAA